MTMTYHQLEARIKDLESRIAGAATRGVLKETYDDGGVQRSKVDGFAGEELDQIQYAMPFGITTVPPKGSDVILLSLGGNRDGAVAIAQMSSGARPKGLSEGDVMIYDLSGNAISLGKDGMAMQDKNGNSIQMSNGSLVIVGNVQVTGTITCNGKDISDTHTHVGVTPGPGNTGVPA